MSDASTTPEDERAMSMLLIGVLELLPSALNSQLMHDSDLTLFDYFVLQQLNEAPAKTLQVKALAACTNSTLPRMSRVASRLEKEGLVSRSASKGGGRAVDVTLTESGMKRGSEAMPGHLHALQSLVFDALNPDQQAHLREICIALLLRLHPDMDEPIKQHLADL